MFPKFSLWILKHSSLRNKGVVKKEWTAPKSKLIWLNWSQVGLFKLLLFCSSRFTISIFSLFQIRQPMRPWLLQRSKNVLNSYDLCSGVSLPSIGNQTTKFYALLKLGFLDWSCLWFSNISWAFFCVQFMSGVCNKKIWNPCSKSYEGLQAFKFKSFL